MIENRMLVADGNNIRLHVSQEVTAAPLNLPAAELANSIVELCKTMIYPGDTC